MIGSGTSSARDLTDRRLAGRYHLRYRLAVGGMAEVWEADDTVLSRRVAVKIPHTHLLDDPVALDRFRSEAIAAARLSHPNVVAVYDTCSEPDGVEAIVMELIRGVTLRDWLDRFGPLPVERVLDLGVAVADALDAAHRTGLIHRDIKPANILLCDDRRVKVTDFGVAKALRDPDRTSEGLVVGTARYLAPEQVEGRALDPRADLYSLGLVLHESLVGQLPFSGDSDAAVALARLHQDPAPPSSLRSDVPVALDAVVGRALARDPQHRWSTAREMSTALATLATTTRSRHSDQTHAVRVAPPYPPPAVGARDDSTVVAHSRSWVVPAVGIGVVLACLALVALLLGGTESGRSLVGAIVDAVSGDDAPPAEASDPTAAVTAGQPPLAGAVATAFDPEGDGWEHDDKAFFAIDGDPTTAWTTEQYFSPLSQLKSGVGLRVDLAAPVTLDELVVITPTTGWAAAIYVADAPHDTLDAWGEPVAVREGIDGNGRFDLGGRQGASLLVWITDLGDQGPPHRLTIADLELTAG